MYFASDNWAGAHPKIAQSLVENASGYASAYGTSELDRRVEEKFNDLFEREVAVFFVSTGTAANALALAAFNKPGAIGFCHREAHIREDECGAPEYFAHGARLRIVDGPNGKMTPTALKAQINEIIDFGVPGGAPAFVSITQGTEAGTLHSLDEIAALAEVSKRHRLPLHMDGARFANAIQSLGVSPADMTWRNGVDVLSFGGTKNGCWCAEALIFMNPADAEAMPYLRKRAAQVFSKSRFMAAQFSTYLAGGLWLDLANRANQAAAALETIIRNSNRSRMAWPREINEVFAIMKKSDADRLRDMGAHFYDWPNPFGLDSITAQDETIVRMVTNYATNEEELEAFASLLAE